MDWFTELGAIVMYMTIIPTISSFLVGICLYIEGMVEDLRNALVEFDKTKTSQEIWFIYVHKFGFHRDIIE